MTHRQQKPNPKRESIWKKPTADKPPTLEKLTDKDLDSVAGGRRRRRR
ncbi:MULTISPECIES: hypothetical protein [Okeania]|nr:MULTISPECIES: hypothetical protein [Okeania]NET13584.1 hypothetical protein [Okeania sp. SIO1H6]NES76391.1 hypothetical protein [Okeania sp. SIO1H4]NET19838.1 hypothetical protein [Okeania sp. SIO1H5]NET78216.1 hypothetical protein [Okeania sp. SIO1F9]NET94732.1 hypothetical protein [Okeania sp. SIO1H2]